MTYTVEVYKAPVEVTEDEDGYIMETIAVTGKLYEVFWEEFDADGVSVDERETTLVDSSANPLDLRLVTPPARGAAINHYLDVSRAGRYFVLTGQMPCA
jgi:hypothetical protein